VGEEGKRRRGFGEKRKGRDGENRKVNIGNIRGDILCLLEVL
jgi:hypothetical protein